MHWGCLVQLRTWKKPGGENHCSWRRRADYLRPLHHSADVFLAHTRGQEGQRMGSWRASDVVVVITSLPRSPPRLSPRSAFQAWRGSVVVGDSVPTSVSGTTSPANGYEDDARYVRRSHRIAKKLRSQQGDKKARPLANERLRKPQPHCTQHPQPPTHTVLLEHKKQCLNCKHGLAAIRVAVNSWLSMRNLVARFVYFLAADKLDVKEGCQFHWLQPALPQTGIETLPEMSPDSLNDSQNQSISVTK